jgi:hypothetical protein
MAKFYITESAKTIAPEIQYLLKLWQVNAQTNVQISDEERGAITIGTNTYDQLRICHPFASRNFFVDPKFNHEGYVVNPENGSIDFLYTAFYLVNSLQEYNDQDKDELGRFKYKNSHQCQLNTIQQNIVQRCFDEISRLAGHTTSSFKSKFFLSHDIDAVYGAILEDGFNTIKRGRIDQFLGLLLNVAVGKPDWLNIDKVLKIESEYDCRSVFYWIVNKGRINQREVNADYSFQSSKIQKYYRMVEESGWENGIHKSISSDTFAQEFQKFGKIPLGNRYHYLKYSLPKAYHDIETAGLKLDASLGFAEESGFRNNYGLPFNPYNFSERRPFSFVEVPLHVMDRTFFQYQKINPQEAGKRIISFFEKNNTNCVLSVLWHNNFFSEYKFKGYLKLYKNILAYIKENNHSTITQQEIIQQYSSV